MAILIAICGGLAVFLVLSLALWAGERSDLKLALANKSKALGQAYQVLTDDEKEQLATVAPSGALSEVDEDEKVAAYFEAEPKARAEIKRRERNGVYEPTQHWAKGIPCPTCGGDDRCPYGTCLTCRGYGRVTFAQVEGQTKADSGIVSCKPIRYQRTTGNST